MNNEHLPFYEDEASAGNGGGAAEALKRVSEMADVLTAADRAVQDAERALEQAEANYRRIACEDFPDLLREVGLPEVKLADGRKIVLNDDIECGISEERASAAFSWLREHGFGGVIKTELKLQFSKGEEAQVGEVVAAIRALGRAPEVKDSVHWQTLKSLVKEQREAGKPPPSDVFGVHEVSQTLVAEPGKARATKPKRLYSKSKRKD